MSSNEVQVSKRSDKLAKVFLILPIVFLVLGQILFIGGCILETPTSRGVIYTFIMLGSFICFGLDIIPGMIFAVIGMIRAAKAKMTGFFVLGIVEVITAVMFVAGVLFVIFVAGQGV